MIVFASAEKYRSIILVLLVKSQKTFHRNSSIDIFGNGGSGASARHIAGDFLKSLNMGQDKKLRILFNDNAPALGAISKDLCYEDVFALQLQALFQPKDLVIGLSGSGNSENVIRAIQYANENKAISMACVGIEGGKVKNLAQHCIHVPVQDMEISEDIHMMIFHMIKKSPSRSIQF